MLHKCSAAVFALFGLLLLCCCASVDQFGSRIYDGNINSQNALNQEILLNIVRASYNQSPNFIGLSQITGGQTETLSTGLPTISIGPNQTVADHIYQVSDSVSSGVTGSYQANPLLSTAFQNGMLTPIDPRTVALLVASHLIDVTFYAVIDSIKIVDKNKRVAYLRNDPRYNSTNPESTEIDTERCHELYNRSVTLGNNLFPPYTDVCNYEKFINVLTSLIDNGLTVDLKANAAETTLAATQGQQGQSTSATPPATTSSSTSGYFCFDPALASLNFQAKITKETDLAAALCDNAAGGKPSTPAVSTSVAVKTTKGDTVTTTTTTTAASADSKKSTKVLFNYSTLGPVDIEIRLRSPAQVLNYLGVWLGRPEPIAFRGYERLTSIQLLGDEPYLDVVPGGGPSCYASIAYQGQSYCVPTSSQHSAMLMDILEDLRNLNIQPTDLNAAFTVRLAQ